MILEPITNQPTITADRFVLRPVRKSDSGLLQMYSADERIARGTRSIPHPLPPGAIDAFVARAQTQSAEDIWVLDGNAIGLDEVLGVIALERMDRNQSEVSFWIAPACWNSGLASEAVEAIVRIAGSLPQFVTHDGTRVATAAGAGHRLSAVYGWLNPVPEALDRPQEPLLRLVPPVVPEGLADLGAGAGALLRRDGDPRAGPPQCQGRVSQDHCPGPAGRLRAEPQEARPAVEGVWVAAGAQEVARLGPGAPVRIHRE